jgi:hypothetical protein
MKPSPGKNTGPVSCKVCFLFETEFPAPTTTPPVIVKHSTATNYELKAPLLLQSLKEI